MPPTPSQIKEQLLSAIDQDDNIVDMGCVTKAITLLESNPISKVALEETRLARYVQIIRKKTKDKSLRNRCTALIRQWQQFLHNAPTKGGTAPTKVGTAPTKGVKAPKTDSPAPHQNEVKGQEGASTSERQKSKPGKQQTNTLPVDKSKSENLRRRKRELESSPSISPSSQGPPTKKLASSQGKSPAAQEGGNGQDDSSLNGVSAKGDGGRGRTTVRNTLRVDSPQTSSASPKTKPSISKEKGSLKKLKRDLSASPHPRTKDISNAVSPALTPDKQLKVRTSEERSSPGIVVTIGSKRPKTSPGSASQVSVKKSKNSSNEKSPRQSNNYPSSKSPSVKDKDTSKTQGVFSTDWDAASPSCSDSRFAEDSLFDKTPLDSLPPSSSSKSLSIFDLDFGSSVTEPEAPSGSMFDAPLSPPTQEDIAGPGMLFTASSVAEDIQSEEDASPDGPIGSDRDAEVPVSKLETLEDDPATPPAPVLESDIDRIHDEEWAGVNGCYNNRGKWFDWMQCLTVDTDEENSIQILPYVCID